MKLSRIVRELQLDVYAGNRNLDADVTRGYASDLLSDVIANAEEADVWITLQTHQNIVAVAVMKSLAAIVLVNNRQPDEQTVEKAQEENVPLLGAHLTTFELVSKLAGLGMKGK